MTHDLGKSHRPTVPAKSPNKDGAERMQSQGELYTGTKVETPDTAKGCLRSRAKVGSRTRRGWREGGRPRGMRACKTRPGLRAGPA